MYQQEDRMALPRLYSKFNRELQQDQSKSKNLIVHDTNENP